MKITDYSKTTITDRRGKEYKNIYASLKEQLNDILFCFKKNRKVGTDRLNNTFAIRKHYITSALAIVTSRIVISNKDIKYIEYRVKNAEVCYKSYNSYYGRRENISLDVFENARLYIINDLKHTLKQVERNYNIKNGRIEDE